MEQNGRYEYSDETELNTSKQVQLNLVKLKLEQLSCSTCSSIFASVTSLNTHMLTHVKDEPLGCKYGDENVKHNALHNSLHDINEEFPISNHAYKSQKDAVLACLLYTSPSPRDKRQSRMPSSA